jgi:hypothetical protein
MTWVMDSVLLLHPIILNKQLSNKKRNDTDNTNNQGEEEDQEEDKKEMDAIDDPRSYATLTLAILTIPEKEHDSGNVIDDVDLIRDRDGNEDTTLKFPSMPAVEASNSGTTNSMSAAAAPAMQRNSLLLEQKGLKVASASFLGSPISVDGTAAVLNIHSGEMNENEIYNQISVMKIHPALMTLAKPSSSTPLLKNILDLLSMSLNHPSTKTSAEGKVGMNLFSSRKYISTSWKLCSVLSRLCRVPVFRANLVILGCLPILFQALTVGTKLINLKHAGGGGGGGGSSSRLGKGGLTSMETELNTTMNFKTAKDSQYHHHHPHHDSHNKTFRKKMDYMDRNMLKEDEEASCLLGGAPDANSWSRGEPTTMVATIGWLQRYACEALLNIGQDP